MQSVKVETAQKKSEKYVSATGTSNIITIMEKRLSKFKRLQHEMRKQANVFSFYQQKKHKCGSQLSFFGYLTFYVLVTASCVGSFLTPDALYVTNILHKHSGSAQFINATAVIALPFGMQLSQCQTDWSAEQKLRRV